MEDVSRRHFVGAMGAMGAMGALGLVGAGGIEVVRADEAAGSVPAEVPLDMTLELPMDADAATLPNGRLDAVRLATSLTDAQLDAMLLDEVRVEQDYVTPSGKVIPALYVNVRNRFNRLGIGLGSLPDEETGWDTIIENFPEDEAQCYLELPMFKWFAAQEWAANSGRDLAECSAMLDKMADHSLIIRTRRAGVAYYALMAPLWGMWEMNMDKFDADWCATFNGALGADFALSAVNCVRPVCQIVPIGPEVVDGDLVPYTSWRDTIENAEVFALSPCQCRLERDVMGIAECTPEEHDRESCISVGEAAEYYIERGIGRPITKAEAMAKVQGNVDKGMVVELLYSKKAEVICQCHSDCCKLLSTYYALGGVGNMMENISFYNLNYDKDTCIKCGACVGRCPMRAITLEEDGCVMAPQCVRCGQCAAICPVQARSLSAKDRLIELPDDMIDDYHQYSKLRMAEGYVKDFIPGAQA